MQTMGEDYDDNVFAETSVDLPDVPVPQSLSPGELQSDLDRQNFLATIRKDLKITEAINPEVYKRLTQDDEGYFYYNHKRLTTKRGKRLQSVNTLLRNPDTREFLQMTGYTGQGRDFETVAPEQTTAIESKIESFKITEEWAREKKDKATRQLEQTSDENERQTLEELIQKYDQMEIQAQRRYNEVVQNQLRRINAIINDETRPLTERLRELFRRDGLTIGALITAVGMIISTIALALLPTKSPSIPTQPGKKDFTDKIKHALIKVATWFLDMAKKALISIPGILGGLLSSLLKKAGEAVLFFSEHLLILLMVLLIFVAEFIWRRKLKTT